MTLKGQGRDPTVGLISRQQYKVQQWDRYYVQLNVFLLTSCSSAQLSSDR